MERHGIYLVYEADGATPEECERGAAAAWEVFETAGINPWAAATAIFKRESEGDDEGVELNDAERRHADVWCDAQEAARAACCAQWGERRVTGGLCLLREGDWDAIRRVAVRDAKLEPLKVRTESR